MTGRSPVHVAMVDDHVLLAEGLKHASADQPAITIGPTVATVDELLTSGAAIDVVILDLRLADGSSPVENVSRLRAAGAKVVVYTSGENPHLIRLAARSDIAGLVRKSESLDVLFEVIAGAVADRAVLSVDLAAALRADPLLDAAGLSAQEQRVLSLFADGCNTQTVAITLGIAVGTVDDYVRRIRAKYARQGRHAHTKIDLYKRALEDGLLPLPGQ